MAENKEPTLPRILGSSESFQEKVKNWNIGNILGATSQDKKTEEENPGNVTITGSDSQAKKMDTGESDSQKAQDVANQIMNEEGKASARTPQNPKTPKPQNP